MSTDRRLIALLLVAVSLGGGAVLAQTPAGSAVTNPPPVQLLAPLPTNAIPVLFPTNAVPVFAPTNAVPPTAATNPPSGSATSTLEETQGVYEDIALMTEAMLLVRRHYVDELDYRKIVYSAIHGMLSNLDPHSDFLEPKQSDGLKEETEAKFGGIGIQIGTRNGFPLVIAPIEDSPAYAAGLLSGDLIVAIEGQPSFDLNLEQIMQKLRGKPGTSVTVTIGREGRDPFDVTLVRDNIKVASVKGARVLGSGIGYLRITQFSEPTGGEVARALANLLTNDLAGLVLDLRDNPGGLLNQAITVAGQFLPNKAVVVSTRGRAGVHDDETFRASGTRHLTDLPMAILINRGSASASEIVTGALQDAGRAIVIGEKSFGKASVQKVLPLATREHCMLKLTTAHYYTPKGRMIHGTGIEPDIAVPLPPSEWRKVQLKRDYEERPAVYPAAARQDLDAVTDPQLQRAMDVLTGVHIFGARPKP
jgi:carboxyl-terminal processing protease